MRKKNRTTTRSGKEFHPWDTRMKWLSTVAPEDMIALLLGDGVEFVGLANTELESETIVSDMLYYVTRGKRKGLLHIEFQKRRDSNMADRLWEYNSRAKIKYGLPVWSCVIYLTKDSTPEGPCWWTFPLTDRSVQMFDFDVVKMWEIPTETLLSLDRLSLLPLLPLTREGLRREVIDRAIDLLMPRGEEPHRNLLSLTYGFASLVFKQEDQEWLQWRFDMLYDILRESPAFQRMAQEGKREGLEQGRVEGLEQGRAEGLSMLREMAANLLVTRFSNAAITVDMLHILDGIADMRTLQLVTLNLATVQTPEAAQQILTDLR
jgi:predicted transposase YdaD